MVVVPADDDVLVLKFGVIAFDDGNEVVVSTCAVGFKRHSVVVVPKGFEPHFAPLACDVVGGTDGVGTAGLAPVEAVGCQGIDVLLQPLALGGALCREGCGGQ